MTLYICSEVCELKLPIIIVVEGLGHIIDSGAWSEISAWRVAPNGREKGLG